MSRRKKRILIVDFDKSCLDFFTGLMKKRNSEHYLKGGQMWRIMPCDTGCGALAVSDKELPDLALVELKLRDMEGLYLVKSLALRGVDVYVASSQESLFTEAIRAGAKQCLKKPLDAEKFLTIIKQYENG